MPRRYGSRLSLQLLVRPLPLHPQLCVHSGACRRHIPFGRHCKLLVCHYHLHCRGGVCRNRRRRDRYGGHSIRPGSAFRTQGGVGSQGGAHQRLGYARFNFLCCHMVGTEARCAPPEIRRWSTTNVQDVRFLVLLVVPAMQCRYGWQSIGCHPRSACGVLLHHTTSRRCSPSCSCGWSAGGGGGGGHSR